MGFGRDHPTEGGSAAIVPAVRYRVVSNEPRPANIERRVRVNEVTDHQSE